jgi:hypothetical protein
MKFITPTAEELAGLRADPLIFEQELDVRPQVASSLEAALGSGQLYAIELGDFGRGRPSMAILYGFWPRYEPRPIDDAAIDADLVEFLLWMAGACDGLDSEDVQWTLDRTPRGRARRA